MVHYKSYSIGRVFGNHCRYFPAFAMKLLDFVAVYGFILAPVGAVVVFEYYFADRYGVIKNYAEKSNIAFNKSVFLPG